MKLLGKQTPKLAEFKSFSPARGTRTPPIFAGLSVSLKKDAGLVENSGCAGVPHKIFQKAIVRSAMLTDRTRTAEIFFRSFEPSPYNHEFYNSMKTSPMNRRRVDERQKACVNSRPWAES